MRETDARLRSLAADVDIELGSNADTEEPKTHSDASSPRIVLRVKTSPAPVADGDEIFRAEPTGGHESPSPPQAVLLNDECQTENNPLDERLEEDANITPDVDYLWGILEGATMPDHPANSVEDTANQRAIESQPSANLEVNTHQEPSLHGSLAPTQDSHVSSNAANGDQSMNVRKFSRDATPYRAESEEDVADASPQSTGSSTIVVALPQPWRRVLSEPPTEDTTMEDVQSVEDVGGPASSSKDGHDADNAMTEIDLHKAVQPEESEAVSEKPQEPDPPIPSPRVEYEGEPLHQAPPEMTPQPVQDDSPEQPTEEATAADIPMADAEEPPEPNLENGPTEASSTVANPSYKQAEVDTAAETVQIPEHVYCEMTDGPLVLPPPLEATSEQPLQEVSSQSSAVLRVQDTIPSPKEVSSEVTQAHEDATTYVDELSQLAPKASETRIDNRERVPSPDPHPNNTSIKDVPENSSRFLRVGEAVQQRAEQHQLTEPTSATLNQAAGLADDNGYHSEATSELSEPPSDYPAPVKTVTEPQVRLFLPV